MFGFFSNPLNFLFFRFSSALFFSLKTPSPFPHFFGFMFIPLYLDFFAVSLFNSLQNSFLYLCFRSFSKCRLNFCYFTKSRLQNEGIHCLICRIWLGSESKIYENCKQKELKEQKEEKRKNQMKKLKIARKNNNQKQGRT